jgi:S-adenosylmethionine-diacylglycerol 3-amino-3-carboxypropyl transferase
MKDTLINTSKISNALFQNIHGNNLIYNTCWEDPRCDRQLLNIQPDSRLVMITSAGCNALDYALDCPSEIHCVDMNPRQNALLELKKAAFSYGSHDDLYQLFGDGVHKDVYAFYKDGLRPFLPDFAQAYWDKNAHFFIGKGVRKSFYWHSTSGVFAWSFSKYLKFQKKNHRLATRLFEAQTLDEQQGIYYELEHKILNNFVKWMLQRTIVMSMLGVPKSQQDMITEGEGNFIQKCLRQVFTQLPIQDNYFWQLYFNGKYTKNCCPNYLKPQFFNLLQQQSTSIKTHTCTLSDFLKQNPGSYSHFVLLDHQDWLAAHNKAALHDEWRDILNNSHSGTRILMRSAAYEVDFFPDFVKDKIEFEKEKTQLLHKQDRVGTYGSVYLGIVK